MKTTIDIPEKELRDVLKFTHAKTKKDAVVGAIADFNRRKRMAGLAKHLGTFDSLMTNEEIEAFDTQEFKEQFSENR